MIAETPNRPIFIAHSGDLNCEFGIINASYQGTDLIFVSLCLNANKLRGGALRKESGREDSNFQPLGAKPAGLISVLFAKRAIRQKPL